MKVSFETPIDLLHESKSYNDYDYALVHLFKHHEYLRYFENATKSGREVILDNSAFELGESFNLKEFLFWAKYLEALAPDPKNLVVVIPDSLHNVDATLSLTDEFLQMSKELKCRRMFVVQGKDFAQRIYCALSYNDFLKEGDLLALNLTPSVYNEKDFSSMALEVREFHRQLILEKLCELQDAGFLKKVNFHLLGCHNALLMNRYKKSKFKDRIESLDTSAPVVLGFSGHRINQYAGKLDIMFQHIVDLKLDNVKRDLIYKNADYFKHNILGDRKESPFPESIK